MRITLHLNFESEKKHKKIWNCSNNEQTVVNEDASAITTRTLSLLAFSIFISEKRESKSEEPVTFTLKKGFWPKNQIISLMISTCFPRTSAQKT